MIKFNDIMKVGLCGKTVSFTGREKFRVEDAAFKKGLLALGIFAEQDDGTLRYIGDVTIRDKSGKEHKVDADGYLAIDAQDLDETTKRLFV